MKPLAGEMHRRLLKLHLMTKKHDYLRLTEPDVNMSLNSTQLTIIIFVCKNMYKMI